MMNEIAVIGRESELVRAVVEGTIDNDKVWSAFKAAEKIARMYEDSEEKVRQIRESQARYLVQLIERNAPCEVFKNVKNRSNFQILKGFVGEGHVTVGKIYEYISDGDTMGTIVKAVSYEIDARRKMNDMNEIEHAVEQYKHCGKTTVSHEMFIGTPERYKEAVCGRVRQRLLRIGAVCVGDGVYVDPNGAESDEINRAINMRLRNIRDAILSVQELMSQQKDDFVLYNDDVMQAVFDFVVDYKEGVAD